MNGPISNSLRPEFRRAEPRPRRRLTSTLTAQEIFMANPDCSRPRKMLAMLMAVTITVGPGITPAFAADKGDANTVTPIKHVIVIVGENRSFDHLFATYVPKPGETVNNLLSEEIVKQNGTPGSNYSRAVQHSANVAGSSTYQLSPTTGKASYVTLPAPLTGGPSDVCKDNGMCTFS